MLPWGHAALGYLLYSLWCRRKWRGPAGLAVLALGIGTQFPDLVDKPLAWHLGYLPNGRSLAHSLFVALLVVAVVRFIATRVDRRDVGNAFGLGYLSHLGGDALYPVLGGEVHHLRYLGWPLIPAIEYENPPQGILTYLLTLEVTPEMAFEVLLVVVAAAVWYRDGTPGLRLLVPSRLEPYATGPSQDPRDD